VRAVVRESMVSQAAHLLVAVPIELLERLDWSEVPGFVERLQAPDDGLLLVVVNDHVEDGQRVVDVFIVVLPAVCRGRR